MTKSAVGISFWRRGRLGVKDGLAAKAEWLRLVERGLAAFGVEPWEADQRIGVRMHQLFASADATASRRFFVDAKSVSFASGIPKRCDDIDRSTKTKLNA